MAFSRAFFQILIRVITMVSFIFGLAYSFYQTELYITPIMFGLLILIAVIELVWYLRRQERNWSRFLLSVKYNDFSRAYNKQTVSKELQEAYDLITQSLEELESGKQAEYHLLRMVLRHISVAVACYREDGEVLFSNQAFNELLGIPGLVHIQRLTDRHPKIHEVMVSSDQKQTEWIDHADGKKLWVKIERFKLKGESYRLISLTDIRSSLDAKELESYQKLMRVMTHEIMNSTTPILSLIKVVNQKLVTEEGLKVLEPRDQMNTATSLKAIEERTAGMLKFVEAYKQINKPIELNKESVQSEQLLEMVTAIMDTSSNALVTVNDYLKSEVFLDKTLMSQVLINLVKNAIEVLEGIKNGQIIIELRAKEDIISFDVVDNGPGVSPKAINQIFIPFYTTKTDGSGIGLALSRKIVKAHGGTLEYDRADGRSRFSIVIPLDLS